MQLLTKCRRGFTDLYIYILFFGIPLTKKCMLRKATEIDLIYVLGVSESDPIGMILIGMGMDQSVVPCSAVPLPPLSPIKCIVRDSHS